ncbi:aldehyde dehydrogenase family protein, partial [Streptomyces sp. NPDC002130]|uniref:aldehyde dehydrogenase family protein n=1 Tax=Streptomyces sp. NPDC002130 TaxID=3155568 RepID=UPI003333EACE
MTTFESTPGQLFIGGRWREAADGARTEVIDPSRGTVVTTVAEAGPADVDAAVRAAREAFDDGAWSGLSGRERGRVLQRVAQLIRENADELAALESLDVGKPITLCGAVDVTNAANDYEYYAHLAQSQDGALRDLPMNALAYTKREPLGVVAAITPFNFPLILAGSKLAPALAAGN